MEEAFFCVFMVVKEAFFLMLSFDPYFFYENSFALSIVR